MALLAAAPKTAERALRAAGRRADRPLPRRPGSRRRRGIVSTVSERMFADVAWSWESGLDEAQVQVATHAAEPLIVLAGAGTGKTRAVTARVASLIDRGVPPQQILLLTFTRRAADDMVERALSLVDRRGPGRPEGGTFHAVAYRHLSAFTDVLGLPKGFGVLDPAGSADLVDLLRDEHGLVGAQVRAPRSPTLVDIYSRCVNTNRRLRDVVPTEFPWCEPHVDAIAALFGAYVERKRRSALLDFDDLLLHWRALLQSEGLGTQLAERFPYVLVDEYQDVNHLQVDIVDLLAPAGRGLTIVGDEAQAIYGFRGSDPRRLRQLVSSYPQATMVRLQRNFRSVQRILDVANVVRPPSGSEGVIALVGDRGDGPRPTLLRCYDAASEARAVVNGILESHERGVPLRDHAVLVRAGHHCDLVELELSLRRVPYRKYGGLRFLEAAHIKDFLAACRLVGNAHDELSWYRVLRLHRQIGPSRARSLLAVAQAGVRDALTRWPELVACAPSVVRTRLAETLDLLVKARDATTPGRRADLVARALRPLIEERYDNASCRLGDLERLVGAASSTGDWAAWMAELTLDPPLATSGLAEEPSLDEDYVVISTIHSAKGLEWPIVHLPHLVDGHLPIDMALGTPDGLNEERRLLYVAVTRARDELHLYAPLRLPHHRRGRDDRHSYAPLSRFVDAEVRAALDVHDEGRVPNPIAGMSGEVVSVDLDPLWR
jgi:DNA helicase II / ATP-dependent DNA helicase PcrA